MMATRQLCLVSQSGSAWLFCCSRPRPPHHRVWQDKLYSASHTTSPGPTPNIQYSSWEPGSVCAPVLLAENMLPGHKRQYNTPCVAVNFECTLSVVSSRLHPMISSSYRLSVLYSADAAMLVLCAGYATQLTPQSISKALRNGLMEWRPVQVGRS